MQSALADRQVAKHLIPADPGTADTQQSIYFTIEQFDPEFFAKFAPSCLQRGLAGLDMATGKSDFTAMSVAVTDTTQIQEFPTSAALVQAEHHCSATQPINCLMIANGHP